MGLVNIGHTPAPNNIGADVSIHISPSGILRLDGAGYTPAAWVLTPTAVSPNTYESSHMKHPLHVLGICTSLKQILRYPTQHVSGQSQP